MQPIRECSSAVADIVFVLDTSGSIRDANPKDGSTDNWQRMLSFLIELVDELEISAEKNRVGLVRFSDIGESLWYLDTYTDRQSLKQAIAGVGFLGSNTNTSGGLRVMTFEQFTPSHGDRPFVKNIAIVLTDGASTYDRNRTISDAEIAHKRNIKIFTVGVTDQVNGEELKNMSSPPQIENKNYFMSDTYEELAMMESAIVKETCILSQIRAPAPGEVRSKT